MSVYLDVLFHLELFKSLSSLLHFYPQTNKELRVVVLRSILKTRLGRIYINFN